MMMHLRGRLRDATIAIDALAAASNHLCNRMMAGKIPAKDVLAAQLVINLCISRVKDAPVPPKTEWSKVLG